jgi:polyribonucleotide nucleotidyltransferase
VNWRNFRVKQTEDIVKLGDEIWVKCLGVDEKGRVRLSRKAAMADRDQEMGAALPAASRAAKAAPLVAKVAGSAMSV